MTNSAQYETIGQIQTNCIFNLDLPSGVITDEGQAAIRERIYRHLSEQYPNAVCTQYYLPSDWDWRAKVLGRGEYVGSFCKRVAKYFYQSYGWKLNSDFLGEIGAIVGANTLRHKSYRFDYDDNLNWTDGDYGDNGSCYWGDHESARLALQDCGAYAIRFSDPDCGYYQGTGRAWIVPQGGSYYIFNAYGPYELPEVVQVFSAHLGLSYRRIRLCNFGERHGDLYINGSKDLDKPNAYVVGHEPAINGVNYHDLEIECENLYECRFCGSRVHADDYYSVGDDTVCENCYNEHYSCCPNCGEVSENVSFAEVTCGDYWCDDCRAPLPICDDCGLEGDNIDEEYGLCPSCLENAPRCVDCGDPVPNSDRDFANVRCPDCQDKYIEEGIAVA